ncbi:hypothetical protein CTI12_AA382090 [Artemisia annua]|uniref:Uncharacterized protein n=1 Tax=Artemisia annua TaxID=35608 RepID=A0A2U1MBU4_ARTAN|nr:hypothetical protein CTI12_AA382090 [Artemisia annua]
MFKKASITYWIKAKVKDVRLVLYLLVLQLLGMVVQAVVDLKQHKRKRKPRKKLGKHQRRSLRYSPGIKPFA